MAIQRFNGGFDDMMPQSFSTMLDRFFQDSMSNRERLNRFSPQVDTCETERGFEIDVSLPGLRKEDISLDFQQGRLTISGERQFNQEKNEKRYHMVESQYGSFSRSFQLPDIVDPNGIEAVFENGVLRVTVPKDERKTARQRIEVREGSNGGNANMRLDAQSQQHSNQFEEANTAIRENASKKQKAPSK
ncbi:Hsp20 family protein [Nibribacter ruber]|uniref:Hsp20 family protein n=1 Tax=Nibribacter ruber TaxID=2698458 RepID=A0A6P1NZR2_9BACT|nr:Hsp20/alpha crystallin family protein [Nibribacter ruber]QHL88014.1 Hsp20 family protein [Nibribacter ruber]